MSGQIFISYRRQDTWGVAGRLFDRLSAQFGRSQIFKDLDSIDLGEDFVEVIETTVAKCDVLIAVIGNNWLASKDDHGNRRLDNPEDFVRMEIGTALKRKIRVIPVLVDGALMPPSTELPEDLKLLVRRNALRLTDTSFDGDCQRLVDTIKPILEEAYRGRGSNFYNQKEYDKAIGELTEAIKLNPKDAATYYIRGKAYRDKHRDMRDTSHYDEAIRDITNAIRLYPRKDVEKVAQAYNSRGNAHSESENYDKAISDYTEAIRLIPNFAMAYLNRGNCYRKQDKTSEAQADFDKAKQLGYTGP